MSSIKDFKVVEEKKKKKEEQLHTPTQDELNKTRQDYGDLIDLFLGKYGEMDEDQLIEEMLKLIEKKKQQGTYDKQQILELASKVAPFLNAEQRAKMEDLLKII